ncbi:MAG: hypothetical protein EB127_10470, partial [Alphaproteobacteria bacterium]|nr:hypothetical protein [Alphaproteobacteria bacterium]
MANSSIILSSLDFDTLKNTFKSYLRTQDRFNDYDFDGSNMSVLLDLLSYNTFHNSFYLNMIGSEMFLDSAQLRDSVVSHAKELNYTPQSFKSAIASIAIVVKTSDLTKTSLLVTKGTTFTSNQFNRNFTFSAPENIVLTEYEIADGYKYFGGIFDIYEGYYVTDTFTYSYDNYDRMILSNKNVDISSITATVFEDGGANPILYKLSKSLFDLNSSSQVFFIQGAENDSYELIFGDGVNGRRPKNNSVIAIEYRISNGELPNGCTTFIPDSPISGETNITVSTISNAAGGSVSESIESIKYNAPRHFTTQERAVTTEDYQTLLKGQFPEVNTVYAYGGEDLDIPQYGKVFIAVDLKETDILPDSKKSEYYKFLKPRSPVSIDPVFVSPDYMYLGITSTVKYNVNVTGLSPSDIKTIVSSSILSYAINNLNTFNKTFRYSKLTQQIDNSQLSIISNETDVQLIKRIVPKLSTYDTFSVKFNTPLLIKNFNTLNYSVYSSTFTYKGL